MQVLIFQIGIYLVHKFIERSPSINDYWWYKQDEYRILTDAKEKDLDKWIDTPVGYSAAMKAKKESYDST